MSFYWFCHAVAHMNLDSSILDAILFLTKCPTVTLTSSVAFIGDEMCINEAFCRKHGDDRIRNSCSLVAILDVSLNFLKCQR